ncbi:MAPEG family protein [Paraburkholderia solisilvae]|uniref:MAPEG family protein n=1 Tax=Paraburkholderia solisilvae TaxID=624376 RepID=A0A6J5EY58_9BURK|nr:MAPEG family protein [Paraburkholderia solisilvae]CAB3771500.1 hypothetical protein LMG29739_06051 [Paraburkholderia solisilvae]
MLLPAIVLASYTTLSAWGPGFLGFVLCVVTGIPAQRDLPWTRRQSTISGVRKDGARAGHDNDRLFDAPVAFYVCALILEVDGGYTAFDRYAAWCYVLVRVAYNVSWMTRLDLSVRMGLFFSSSGILLVLTARCLIDVLAR